MIDVANCAYISSASTIQMLLQIPIHTNVDMRLRSLENGGVVPESTSVLLHTLNTQSLLDRVCAVVVSQGCARRAPRKSSKRSHLVHLADEDERRKHERVELDEMQDSQSQSMAKFRVAKFWGSMLDLELELVLQSLPHHERSRAAGAGTAQKLLFRHVAHISQASCRCSSN